MRKLSLRLAIVWHELARVPTCRKASFSHCVSKEVVDAAAELLGNEATLASGFDPDW